MKDKLLLLLKENPATAGRPDAFLETLADDIQAVIIRALELEAPVGIVVDLEHQVQDVFNDHFGVKLSNLYTIEPFAGKKKLYYSARRRVILSMIRSMLLEQADQYDRLDSEQAGETLKHRLTYLKLKPGIVN